MVDYFSFFSFFIRTSADEMPSSRLTDLRPERKPTALHKAVTGGEEEGNAGHTDDLTGVVDLSLK